MERKASTGLGAPALVVFAIVCCAGLPLLVGTGVSIAAIGIVGGLAAGLIPAAAVITLLAVRVCRRRDACQVPPDRLKELA
ncbi:MAG: hypothetical protein H0U90_08340 [Actinobacteria bacterium]|nr:hypothetical protein [Actinomycetota bacterium]